MTQFQASFNLVNQGASPGQGYQQAKNQNGGLIPYWYSFAGLDSSGAITVSKSKDGNSTVEITCTSQNTDYLIQSVAFFSDKAKTQPIPWGEGHQFDFELIGDDRQVVIYDWIAEYGGEVPVYFSITVEDTSPGKGDQLVVCDPTIRDTAMPPDAP